MAQRRNYGFERRRKEELRQAKRASKRQRRTERADSEGRGPEIGEPQDTGARPGTAEWLSPSRGRTVSVAAGTRPAEGEPDDWIQLSGDVVEDEREEGAAG